ncbi:MAG: DUF4167 domain-containing protein [Rhizobiaceae bacterium]
MRPQQQNRRMRGRNNNNNSNNNNGGNRKGPNPLTRNYESNGPDVKIRGSAQQIAEKYATLARDAQSAGDRVMAENYLQHAEHYNRIIAAAQAQLALNQPQQFSRDDLDDDMDDEGDEVAAPIEVQTAAPMQTHGSGPQPVIEGTPAEVALAQGQAAEQNGRRHGVQNVNGGNHPEGGEGGEFRRRRPRRGRGRGEFGANGEGANGEGEAHANGDDAGASEAVVETVAASRVPEAPAPAANDEPVAVQN